MVEEHIFYNQEEIIISSTRIALPNKTIAMHAVCSVEINKEEAKTPYVLYILLTLSILMVLFSIKPFAIYAGWIGVLISGVMYLSYIYQLSHLDEAVIVELVSGEKEYIDKDDTFNIDEVYIKINEAIIFRG